MWDIVYRQVSASTNPPRSVQELEIAVVQAWTDSDFGSEHAQLLQRVLRFLWWSYTLLICEFEAFASTVMDSSTFCKSAKNAIR